MKRTASSLLAAPLLAALSASAEPVTLEGAIDLALINAPTLESARARLDAAEAGVDIARSEAGPRLGLRGEVGALETDFTTDRISQIPRSVGLQGEWTVYASGALDASQAASEFLRGSSQAQLLGAREQTVLDAIEAYALTWLALETLRVAEERVTTFRVRFEETTARFQQGQLTRTDVALTEARLASSEAELEAARASLAAAQARLRRLTGLEQPEPESRPDIAPLSLISYDSALVRVMERNPSLAAANLAVDASSARLDETRGRFGPKVSLRARASYGEDVFFFFEDPIADLGAFVTVEVPLYTNGQRAASERQARSNRTSAEADARLARLQLEEAVASLWFNIEARRSALRAARRAEQAAALAAEGTSREFDAGIRTLIDSLDAETAYQDARVATARAEVSLLLAKAQLLSLSADLEAAIDPAR